MRGHRAVWSIALVGATGVVMLAVFVAGRGMEGAGDWADVLSFVLAALVAMASLLVWMTRRASTQAGAEVADRLRRAVRVQWSAELSARQLTRPRPLRLAWRATAHPVQVDTTVKVRKPVRVLRGALAGGDAWLSARALLGTFRARGRGQLVVLGPPGAGKTTLAVLFTVAALDDARPGDAVPVLLPVAGWDPREPVEQWFGRRITQDYPGATDGGKDGREAVHRLIDDRGILPVLDGLDELPSDVLGAAIADLDRAAGAGLPMVITCRHAEYAAAVTQAGGLSNATVVDIEPVRAVDAAQYLTAREIHGSTRWQPVLDALHDHPSGPVASALSTPLMISLARAAYQQPLTDPGQLTEIATAELVEQHLLERFLDTVHPDPAEAARARRWLGFLAVHLRDTTRSPDLQWWRLARAVPGAVFTTASAATLALCGALLGGFFGSTGHTLIEMLVGAGCGLAVGILCGRQLRRAAVDSNATPRRGPVWRRVRTAGGDLIAALAGTAAIGSVSVAALLLLWRAADPANAVDVTTELVASHETLTR